MLKMAEVRINGRQHFLNQFKRRIICKKRKKQLTALVFLGIIFQNLVVLKKFAFEVFYNAPTHQNMIWLYNVAKPINAFVGFLKDLLFL